MSPRGLAQAVADATGAFRAAIPNCVGVAFVDLSTGVLLSAETAVDRSRVFLDMLAAATVEFYQGRTVTMIEDVVKRERGVVSDRHYFQEILINSDNLTHLFLRSRTNQDLVAAVICGRLADTTALVAESRVIMEKLEAQL